MDRRAKITMVVSAATVTGLLVLALPAVLGATTWATEVFGAGSASPAASSSPEPAGSDDDLVDLGDGFSVPAGGPGDCTTSARISIRAEDNEPFHSKLLGDLVEMGPSEWASGEALTDADGEIYAYVVAPGDSPIAIGERFCIDYTTVLSHNHVRVNINPGDVLYLRPDPTLPWVDPYSPFDVQPGEQTGPYYDGIDFMRNAVVAQDLAEAQRVWTGLGPRVHPEARTIATRALEIEDWELLRQMFP
ncbi:LysM peptidoglycan-binding domain-containing protein [Microbacterium sp. NPDC090003]|uniref:LysM peptidoglycan-binding domain-containing protein n=1 Tax=Microbacterium sp. NPDC090003 TaxID=3364203 RepID=UPI0037FCD14F